MRVTVRLFARLRDIAGTAEIAQDIAPGATIMTLLPARSGGTNARSLPSAAGGSGTTTWKREPMSGAQLQASIEQLDAWAGSLDAPLAELTDVAQAQSVARLQQDLRGCAMALLNVQIDLILLVRAVTAVYPCGGRQPVAVRG